jgi:hypothetical protein
MKVNARPERCTVEEASNNLKEARSCGVKREYLKPVIAGARYLKGYEFKIAFRLSSTAYLYRSGRL